MNFVETNIFTKQITAFLTDDEYRGLQVELIGNPEKGSVIPGGKGLRKMRWGASSKGKRGGLRIIYYVQFREDEILMLFAYKKNDLDNLTKEQLKGLVKIIEERYK